MVKFQGYHGHPVYINADRVDAVFPIDPDSSEGKQGFKVLIQQGAQEVVLQSELDDVLGALEEAQS
jgi:hypothetical protein